MRRDYCDEALCVDRRKVPLLSSCPNVVSGVHSSQFVAEGLRYTITVGRSPTSGLWYLLSWHSKPWLLHVERRRHRRSVPSSVKDTTFCAVECQIESSKVDVLNRRVKSKAKLTGRFDVCCRRPQLYWLILNFTHTNPPPQSPIQVPCTHTIFTPPKKISKHLSHHHHKLRFKGTARRRRVVFVF